MALRVDITTTLDSVEAQAWNALGDPNNPFVEHAFLHTLETSRSVNAPRTGWNSCHLLCHDPKGELVGAMPLYLKTDSYGEYIFDWAWASAAEQAGIDYYPKLTAAVPFTPATGPRLLAPSSLAPDTRRAVQEALLGGLQEFSDGQGASSSHALFIPKVETALWRKHGWLERDSFQFHWRRRDGWEVFDDFVHTMRRGPRKQVLRERREAAALGLDFSMEPGTDLRPKDFARLYQFYLRTCAKKGAIPYLNEPFFTEMPGPLRTRLLVACARRHGELQAAAIFFRKGTHLYGRYWGSVEENRWAHFELCYYLPVEWALGHGITLIEAGAQGAHKLKRGFLPVRTKSAHRIAHPGLQNAVGTFLEHERQEVTQAIDYYRAQSPFKEQSAPHGTP